MNRIIPTHCIWLGALLCLGWLAASAEAQTNPPAEVGFSRIIRGWTNYSTAFSITHDLGLQGEFATVASFYTPTTDVKALEFGVIVVWLGPGGQKVNFGDFAFTVSFWSSLDAFIRNPRRGDVAARPFAAPTGGSTTIPDTVTRGGRPAYELRFSLTNAPILLTRCQTYLVGLAAETNPNQSGELFVPTSRHPGSSDVQGGNIVPHGWIYLLNAGGLTIYDGQAATELIVQRAGPPPALAIQWTNGHVELLWPAAAHCFHLESTGDLSSPEGWSVWPEEPVVESGINKVTLSTPGTARLFRLNGGRERPLDHPAILWPVP